MCSNRSPRALGREKPFFRIKGFSLPNPLFSKRTGQGSAPTPQTRKFVVKFFSLLDFFPARKKPEGRHFLTSMSMPALLASCESAHSEPRGGPLQATLANVAWVGGFEGSMAREGFLLDLNNDPSMKELGVNNLELAADAMQIALVNQLGAQGINFGDDRLLGKLYQNVITGKRDGMINDGNSLRWSADGKTATIGAEDLTNAKVNGNKTMHDMLYKALSEQGLTPAQLDKAYHELAKKLPGGYAKVGDTIDLGSGDDNAFDLAKKIAQGLMAPLEEVKGSTAGAGVNNLGGSLQAYFQNIFPSMNYGLASDALAADSQQHYGDLVGYGYRVAAGHPSMQGGKGPYEDGQRTDCTGWEQYAWRQAGYSVGEGAEEAVNNMIPYYDPVSTYYNPDSNKDPNQVYHEAWNDIKNKISSGEIKPGYSMMWYFDKQYDTNPNYSGVPKDEYGVVYNHISRIKDNTMMYSASAGRDKLVDNQSIEGYVKWAASYAKTNNTRLIIKVMRPNPNKIKKTLY